MEKDPANILVVDDTPANLKSLGRILEGNGYHVRLIPDGSLALSSARAELPDLILLDIIMPDLNGYDVCEELKRDKRTREVPVIFISALHDTLDKVKAFSAGGVDYITKPFQEDELLARVHTHLTLRNLSKQLEDQNIRLREALAKIKTLRGLLPICAGCKKIRDDKGYWCRVESYIEQRSEAQFSHGLCDVCAERIYGNTDWYKKRKEKIQAKTDDST